MVVSKFVARACNKRIISKHFSSPLQVNTVQVIMVRPVLLSGRGTSWVGCRGQPNAAFPALEAGAVAITAELWEAGILLSHVTLFLVQ